jgi:ABC-type maltose transport system permease subunit
VLLAAIPVALLFLALQRFIVGGLTQGAVKG